MALSKLNIPVVTESGIPNPNNLSDEMNKIITLAYKLTRSDVGQVLYTSASSGISYNTADYSSDATIYNKGETGLYNLLILELDEYILKAENLNTYGTGTITNTGWGANTGDYKYAKSVAISGVLSTHKVNIDIDKEHQDIANNAHICSTNESYDGGVILYSKLIPSASMNFSYTIFK